MNCALYEGIPKFGVRACIHKIKTYPGSKARYIALSPVYIGVELSYLQHRPLFWDGRVCGPAKIAQQFWCVPESTFGATAARAPTRRSGKIESASRHLSPSVLIRDGQGDGGRLMY